MLLIGKGECKCLKWEVGTHCNREVESGKGRWGGRSRMKLSWICECCVVGLCKSWLYAVLLSKEIGFGAKVCGWEIQPLPTGVKKLSDEEEGEDAWNWVLLTKGQRVVPPHSCCSFWKGLVIVTELCTLRKPSYSTCKGTRLWKTGKIWLSWDSGRCIMSGFENGPNRDP